MRDHREPCLVCGGEGVVVETRYVSRAMALDAGMPEMEGEPVPDEQPCPGCEGEGYVEVLEP